MPRHYNTANRIGAVRYVECSALTQENLKQVFESAIDVHMNPPAEEKVPEPQGGRGGSLRRAT